MRRSFPILAVFHGHEEEDGRMRAGHRLSGDHHHTHFVVVDTLVLHDRTLEVKARTLEVEARTLDLARRASGIAQIHRNPFWVAFLFSFFKKGFDFRVSQKTDSGGVRLGVEGERRFAPRVGLAGDMMDTEPGVSYTFVPVYTCHDLL